MKKEPKTGTVTAAQIAAHPHQSLRARDYLDPNQQPHPNGKLVLGMQAAIDLLRQRHRELRCDPGVAPVSPELQCADYLQRKLWELEGKEICGCGNAPIVPGHAGCIDCEVGVRS